MAIVYFLVALVATTVGALAGLGGGVIIKPSLDVLGHYDIVTISLLSTFTVFSMAVISTYKQIRKGFKVDVRLMYLSLGAIGGGILGKVLFTTMLQWIEADIASGIQSTILAVLLVVVLLRSQLPDWDIHHPLIILLVGLTLGTVASFLGIGGGPINVAVIMMFLAMDIRQAAVSSVFVILLSQMSKIGSFLVVGGLAGYDYSMLLYMIPAAIIGGLVGSRLNRVLDHHHIDRIFNTLVFILVGLNGFNAYQFLF